MADTLFSELVGTVLKSVRLSRNRLRIDFVCKDGRRFRMCHRRHCCETVWVDDVVGDLSDLVGSPILFAEVATDAGAPKTYQWQGETVTDHSSLWTFYKLATIKGHVDIRWYGSSNGNYSEEVDFERVR